MGEPDGVAEFVREEFLEAAHRHAGELRGRVVGDDHALGELPVGHAVNGADVGGREVGAANRERRARVGDLVAGVVEGNRDAAVGRLGVAEAARRTGDAVGETERAAAAPCAERVRDLHRATGWEPGMSARGDIDEDGRTAVGFVPASGDRRGGRGRGRQRRRRVEPREGRDDPGVGRRGARPGQRGQRVEGGDGVFVGDPGAGLDLATPPRRRHRRTRGPRLGLRSGRGGQRPLAVSQSRYGERAVSGPDVKQDHHVFPRGEVGLAADDQGLAADHAPELLQHHRRRRAGEPPCPRHVDRDVGVDGAGVGIPRRRGCDDPSAHGAGARSCQFLVRGGPQ